MRVFTTSAVIVIAVAGAWAAFCAGRWLQQFRDQIGQDVFAQAVEPEARLVNAVATFRLTERRWPKDQKELFFFVGHSNGRLQPVPFNYIAFTPKPDGGVQIYAASSNATNNLTLNVTETNRK